MEVERNWLEKLILEEQEIIEGELITSQLYSTNLTGEEILDERTDAFLETLKQKFEKCIVYFNEFKQDSEQAQKSRIKIFKLSTKKPGFMLSRNNFQLVFYTLKSGEISILLRFDEQSEQDEHKIKGRFIAYGDLEWYFKELKINSDSMVSYYLTYFIRITQRGF